MDRKWLAAAKAAISILLIWYLFDRVDISKVLARAGGLSLVEASSAIVLLLAQAGLVTIRWWLVARVTDTTLRLLATFRILVIGMFFNQTLPSSVGGDAIRIWLVTREGAPLGKAINVVLCDRVFALVILVALIGFTLPAIYSRVHDEATRVALTSLVAISILGFAAFLALGKHVSRFLTHWRITRPFGRLAEDFRQLFVEPWPALLLTCLSSIIHLMTVAAVALIGWGLDLRIGFMDALAVTPIVVLLTTLPISVAGWGVREGAMIAGFGFVGIPADDALALSVLFGLSQIAVSLPGGLVWLADRTRSTSSNLSDVSQ